MDDFLREYEGVLRDANARLRKGVLPAPPRRPVRLVRAAVMLAGAGVLAVLVLALGLLRESPSEERAAAPTPARVPAAAPTFAAPSAPTINMAPLARSTGRFRVARSEVIAPKAIAADPQLDETHGDLEDLVRAWSVPALKGHVYLERRGDDWCLSAPDPVSQMPDIERGMGCNAGDYGASLSIGRNYAAVILDDTVKHPVLKRADGKRTTLTPDEGGLIALANVPQGASITLYNADGKGRTDGF